LEGYEPKSRPEASLFSALKSSYDWWVARGWITHHFRCLRIGEEVHRWGISCCRANSRWRDLRPWL